MKKQNMTEKVEIANSGMSRRSFRGLGALGAAGVAASAAAKEGAQVIGLDRAASMGATNASMVSGVWAIESTPKLAEPNYLTVKNMFDFIWTSTHYQTNAPLLRNVLPASGKGIDLMIEGGVPFMFAFQGADENTPMLNRGGHIYATAGAERAEALQGMLDKFGVDSRWDADVTNPSGKRIAEEELRGGDRRETYGREIVQMLSEELSSQYGKGFSATNLWYYVQFYRSFPEILHAASGESRQLLS